MKGFAKGIEFRAESLSARGSRCRVGLVSSYDPANYCAKVRIMPEDVETGWLPITSPWVGDGWGLFAPPTVGDMVEVQFQEDDIEAGFIVGRFYNDSDRPLPVESGEFWLVHKSGSFLKFHNNGSVELHTAEDLDVTVLANANVSIEGDANVTVAGDTSVAVTGNITSSAAQFTHTGPLTVNGNVQINGTENVSGKITGQAGMAMSGGSGVEVTGNITVTTGDVTADLVSLKSNKTATDNFRNTYNSHTHNENDVGGPTGVPNQQA